MIAPDSNRSATARSITTRSPLTVEEVEFGDGDSRLRDRRHAGRLRALRRAGLVGDRPDLIVSGINHGANLGDDITYSGTVAAAFEGIVLGIPAVAVSQQSSGGGMGYVSGRFDFGVAAAFAAELVRGLIGEPMPEATLINVNCPAGEPNGIEVTQARQTDLQRRAEAGRRGRDGRKPLRDLRLAARLRGDRGHRPQRGRRRAASRSRRSTSTSPTTAASSGCAAGASRRCWRRAPPTSV